MSANDPNEIASIRDDAGRFHHVVKHLYKEAERWDLVVAGLPRSADSGARAAGCPRAVLGAWYPKVDDAPGPCRMRVLADHDRYYEPAYRSALATGIRDGRRGRTRDGSAEALVGENGVYVIVVGSRTRRVVSSYRCVPRAVPPRERTAEQFLKEAVRKLRDATSYGEEDPRGR